MPSPREYVVTGGRPSGPGAAAGAPIAIRDRRFVAPGAGPAPRDAVVIDAGGCTVTPGITDAHIHLLGWAHALGELSLTGARSRAEAIERLRMHVAARAEGVIVGHGWNDHGWEAPPAAAAIDAIAPGRAVILHAHDHHSLWASGEAMRVAGVDGRTADPAGGRIERDAAGRPTGVFRENAARLFAALEADAPREPDARALERAIRRLHALGITGVHDFEGAQAFAALEALARGRGPRVRVLMHLTHAGLDAALADGMRSGTGDDWFRIGHVKLFADGTLGSHTADLLAPYDGTQDSGMALIDPAELRRLVAHAFAGGLSVAVHAIGDRASRSTLDAFEAAGGARAVPLPPRIEHVQLLAPSDRPRFAALGVFASVQPVHCITDIDEAEKSWHTRRDHAYPWRSLLDAGAALAFGSDAPIEAPDVNAALHAATARTRFDGTPAGGWTPGERITLDEALRAFTEGPARLAGAFGRLGTLAPGACADLVIWDRDLHAAGPAGLREARPKLTMLDGEIVHAAKGVDLRNGDALDLELA